MDRRRRALSLAGMCAIAVPALAQQSARIWRIGFLGITSPTAPVSLARVEALKAGLRELGYIEGKNIAIEFRWADSNYEKLPQLVAELVRLNVDVLVTYTTPGAMAAKRATQTIPIVLASVGDPVFSGLVPSLSRPGGNLTGSSIFTADESAKRLELLRDALPRIRRVAILLNPANPLWKASAQTLERVAKPLKLEIIPVEARAPQEFDGAFLAMRDNRADAVVIFEDALFTGEVKALAELALKNRLPAIGGLVFAEAGGLMGNGANQLLLFRRAAVFVDKIFKGAKPADLPIEQATRFELVVNMKAAKALGITLPKQLLFRADRIIE